MDSISQETLRRVESNDNTLTTLKIKNCNFDRNGRFNSSDGRDFSTLGSSIGENTHLTTLVITPNDENLFDVTNRGFFDGLKHNYSIHSLVLHCDMHEIGVGHEVLNTYQESNNLTCLYIGQADLRNGGDVVLAETLRRCTNLREFELFNCNITDVQLLPLIEAIRGYRSLEQLSLFGNSIGRAGCEAIAALLRDPNYNLRSLDLSGNDVHNDGATTLANALLNNTKLRILNLHGNLINQSVVDIFARVLCNTSSINKIYSSNHTFEQLGLSSHGVGYQLDSLLQLNRYTNKSHVAIKKILKYHPSIDMEPLFEWNMEGNGERDLKALPYVIAWFGRARDAVAGTEEGGSKIFRRKLSAIFQFAQDMPLLFVPASHVKGGNKRKRDGN